MTPIQEPQEVELPRGVVAEASAPLPVIQHPDGSTEPAPAGSVLAEDIIGQITSEQIESLEAAKVSGKLTAEQIESIHAASIIGQIVSEQIQSLTAGKITGELEAAQIKEITAVKITGQIVETQIGKEAITTEKLHATAVTAAKIAAEAVEANAIKALTITAAKIAAGAIIAEKIGAEAVEASKIKALSVTTAKLAAEAVIAEKIAASSITTSKLAAESVTAEKISAGTITANKIAAGAITAEKISVVELSGITPKLGTITAGKIEGTIIKIEEANVENIPELSRINWFKEGVVHSWIGGYFAAANFSRIHASANIEGKAQVGEIRLVATSEKEEIHGTLRIEVGTGGSVGVFYQNKRGEVTASHTVFTSESKSGFVQLRGAPAKVEAIGGQVSAAAVGSNKMGEWTAKVVEVAGAPRFIITYSSEFTGGRVPTVLIWPIAGGAIGGNVIYASTTGFEVDMYGLALTRIAAAFNFLAIG